MMTGEIRNYRNLTRNSGWWRYLRIALLTILIWMGTSGGVPAWGRWISPSEAAFWAALFPGGGHFYLHEHKKGAALAATEFSFLGGGIYLDVSRDNCSLTDYNPLYLLAMKEHELSIFLAFREARKAIDDYGFDTPRDDSSVARIIASPFLPENLKDPLVHVFWIGGLALVLTEYFARPPTPGMGYREMNSIRVWDFPLARGRGTAAYEGGATGISLLAAVGEEAAWRGTLQVEYERLMGRKQGWLFTSFFFGLAHLYGPSDWTGRGEAAAVGTIGGLYLGWLLQHSGYRLGPGIAAHFWFNFVSATTAFFLDPDRNPLGFEAGFKF